MAKDKPDAETLKGLLVGPSGNLRAPCLRVGRALVVGFDQATYESLLVKGGRATSAGGKKPAAKAKKK